MNEPLSQHLVGNQRIYMNEKFEKSRRVGNSLIYMVKMYCTQCTIVQTVGHDLMRKNCEFQPIDKQLLNQVDQMLGPVGCLAIFLFTCRLVSSKDNVTVTREYAGTACSMMLY